MSWGHASAWQGPPRSLLGSHGCRSGSAVAGLVSVGLPGCHLHQALPTHMTETLNLQATSPSAGDNSAPPVGVSCPEEKRTLER